MTTNFRNYFRVKTPSQSTVRLTLDGSATASPTMLAFSEYSTWLQWTCGTQGGGGGGGNKRQWKVCSFTVQHKPLRSDSKAEAKDPSLRYFLLGECLLGFGFNSLLCRRSRSFSDKRSFSSPQSYSLIILCYWLCWTDSIEEKGPTRPGDCWFLGCHWGS